MHVKCFNLCTLSFHCSITLDLLGKMLSVSRSSLVKTTLLVFGSFFKKIMLSQNFKPLFGNFSFFDTFFALVESQLLMHEKLFPRYQLKISYQTPPLVPLFSNSSTSSSFFSAFWLLFIPCVKLQNLINLSFSLSVNLLCSSYEDMLLYNKYKIFCKYLLHTWTTRKSCFKSVFYEKKKKMLQKYCSKIKLNLQKLNLLQCLMVGPHAASYIHAQRSTFLLRVDENAACGT